MKRIDLHTHSVYSDGTFTPDDIFRLAQKRNISALALTDHDSIDGLQEAEAAAAKYGIELINGVELSAVIEGLEIHILGYFLTNNIENLNSQLSEMREIREDRNIEMIKKLNEIGVKIDYEDFRDIKLVTRTHFAKLLVEKNYARSIDEGFKKFLCSGCKAYVPKKRLSVEKSIKLIESAKGIAVLAHPLRYGLDFPGIATLARKLIEVGVRGIEVSYPGHNSQDEIALCRLADKYGLVVTGGSDFHGDIKPHINIGDGTSKTMIPYNILESLKNYFGLAL